MSNNRLPTDEQASDAPGFAASTAAIRNGAQSFRERAEEFIGGSNVKEMKDSVKEMADAATERVTATADYLRSAGASRMRADVEEVIKTNPGPALLVAATLGFIVGRALSRD